MRLSGAQIGLLLIAKLLLFPVYFTDTPYRWSAFAATMFITAVLFLAVRRRAA